MTMEEALCFLLLCIGAVDGTLISTSNSSSTVHDDDANATTAAPTAKLEYWQVYGDEYYDFHYTPQEMIIVTWIPKPFSLLSMFCSYTVLREVFSEQRRRGERVGGTPINRMLMDMAVGDILFSIAYFIGTWAAPPIGAYGVEGKGSVGTCTFQGFLYQLGLMVSIFSNTSLSIYYLLVVCRSWTDRDLERAEPWFHGTIWLIALVLSIYPIPLELYNSMGNLCWIGTSPPACFDDWCIRGSNPWPHQLAASLLPVVCLVTSLLCMGIILCRVRQTENTTRKYATSVIQRDSTATARSSTTATARTSTASNFTATNRNSYVNRNKSNAVAKQALFYTLAFLATYTFDVISFISYYGSGQTLHEAFNTIAYSVLLPSAGTFNFLVFSRIRRMKTPEGRILKSIFFCLWCRGPMESISSRISQSTRRRSSTPNRIRTAEVETGGVGADEAPAETTIDTQNPTCTSTPASGEHDPEHVQMVVLGCDAEKLGAGVDCTHHR